MSSSQLAASTTNPYQSPAVATGMPQAICTQRRISALEAQAEFVLPARERRLQITWSGWSGREVYAVDGTERLRLRRFGLRGRRRFGLNAEGADEVEVQFQYFPWWTTRILLDDELIVPEIFPRLRFFFRALSIVLAVELLALLAATAVGALATMP